MKSLISSSFSITAQKDVVSIDHIDNYYLCEATGSTPGATDSRWKKIEDGGTVPVPTSSAPFLWHKYITYLTDGTSYDPIIEFKGSLGENGIDYDLVPSHSSIIKAEDGTLTPTSVSCAMILRNADGSAQTLSKVPTGYSIVVYKDATASAYTLGASVSTSGVSVITFVLRYGNVDVERHDIHVITEGAQGISGRGIQSQEVRFKALAATGTGAAPATPSAPSSASDWNAWSALASCGYSSTNCYLYKCVKTVFVDGNNNTSTEYYVEGPTVWGQDGATPFVVDIDNEMTAVPVSSEGTVTTAKTLSFGLKALYGTSDVISSCEVSCVTSLPSGFTVSVATKAKPTVTIAANTKPSELTELTFRIKHATYGSRDVVFSIAAIKSGGMGDDAVIYQLLPSNSELSVARNDDGTYNPSTVSLTCGYTKRVGKAEATSVADCTAAFDGYEIYFRRFNRSTGWTTYFRYRTYKSAYLNSLNVATYSKVEFVICKDTSYSTTSPTGVIDRETVPIIADGLNGTSPFTVDLDKEMSSVALTSSGVTENAYEDTLKLSAFYGSTALALQTVSASVSNGNIVVDASDVSAIKITVAKGRALDSTNTVTFTCVHSTYGTRTVTYTLAGIKAGAAGTAAVLYEILPDLTQLSFARASNGTTLTPSSRTINFSVKKTEGSSTSVISVANSGLNVRWSGSSMPASASAGNQISPSSPTLTISATTSYTNIYIAVFNGTTLVDRETIPIVKDGIKGATGDTGNGINVVSYARMFTMGFEAPGNTDSGWTEGRTKTEAELSQTNRYLWERKKTTYTTSSNVDYEVYLVAQFNAGACANLLEDTAFFENDYDAWDVMNGSILKAINTGLPQNGWQSSPDWEAAYLELARQEVWNGKDVNKIKPSTWYTLSFYAAMSDWQQLFSGSAYNDSTNNYYGIAVKKKFRIEAGQTVKVRFTGRVANASSGMMKCWLWLDSLDGSSTWLQSAQKELKTTYASTVEVEITNTQSTACICSAQAYMYHSDGTQTSTSDTQYRGYITGISVNRGQQLDTCLYRSGNSTNAISTSDPWYVDGEKVTTAKVLDDGTYVSHAADGNVRWKLSTSVKRHSVTFKTSAFASTTDILRVLFRLTAFANYGWICMPKLEENTMATEWMENTNDRYADDIQHIYVGEWKESTQGNTSTYYLYALGVRHVVLAETSASDSTKVYWRMKKRTTNQGYCSLQQPYADTDNWEKANYLKFVAADLLLTNEVITDKLTVSKIRSANDTFVVDANGNIKAQGGTFEKAIIKDAYITRSYQPWESASSSANSSDNIYKEHWGGNLFVDATVANVGRIIRFTPCALGTSTSDVSGTVKFSTSGSYYFYEDGIMKDSLSLSNEMVELIGLGTATKFIGYAVLRRIDLTTRMRYGHQVKALAMGRMSLVVQNKVFYPTLDYSIFDKKATGESNSLTVERTGTGLYKITLPSKWIEYAKQLLVMVTGEGYVFDGYSRASTFCKATIIERATTYFVVGTSDDATANDGDFSFIVFNKNDWATIDGTIS